MASYILFVQLASTQSYVR